MEAAWFKDGDFKNHILNENNIPITVEFVESIFEKYGLDHRVRNLDNFQLAMVHISYMDRDVVTDKTARMLKDIEPIDDTDYNDTMPLQSDHYDRLEYLGDSVIHHIIAEYLFARYENQDAGFMTKLRTKLEKAETLSILSKKLDLHKYAVIARNIEQANGRIYNTHLTEDIFEAFIGALSLEIKYEKCKKFVISILESEIDMAELIYHNDNYKDQLMQYYHKLKDPRFKEPKYYEDVSQSKIIKQGGNEYKLFTSVVKKGNEIVGTGTGNTKSKAEQAAAYDALIRMGVIDSSNDDENDYWGESDNDGTKDDDDTESLDSQYYDVSD